jgi:xylan 1,4-beta-xylosidase
MPYDKIYTGWAYPPTDYAKWAGLVYRWVTHAVKRYGKTEVESWYWEVWNEPNIGYWQGSPAQYRELYDYTADAVKRACPGARVGGPASTGPGWDKAALFLKAFLAHCDSGRNAVTGRKGAPLDFISFHAKGSPRIVKGQVRMNLATELRDVQSGFRIIAASRFKKLPVLVTEFDPEGCAACGMTTNPENAYRNGTMYSSYTAATFCRLYDLALRYGISLKRATSWSFEFEGQRWFDGFRSLATHGIDKPVLDVFRMYGMMAGDRLGVVNARALPMDSLLASSVHGTTPDVHALATEGKNQTAVMVWNYSDEQAPRQPAMVHLSIKNIPAAKVLLLHFRIDQDHSNAYTAWKRMGSPQQVTPRQYRVLERTGQLQLLRSPRWIKTKDGTAEFSFSLPGEGISLLRLEYQNND